MKASLRLRVPLIGCLVLLSHVVVSQTFVKTGDVLEPVSQGKINWVDLDVDGDLDILYTGSREGSPFTMIYRNDAGTLVEVSHTLPAIMAGAAAWADFDRDGDPDILLAGRTGVDAGITNLYENTGNFTFTLKQTFPALDQAMPAWLDVDNDADSDLLLTGTLLADGQIRTYLYENSGGTFSIVNNSGLLACAQCAVDVADVNGDGDVDIILSGLRSDGPSRTTLHLNNGNKTFRRDTNIKVKNMINGDVRWGDFDNDGDPDLLQTGREDGAASGLLYSTVFENNIGTWKTRSDIVLPTMGENWYQGTTWFDANNDGRLDLALTGRTIDVIQVAHAFKIMINNGNGTFSEAASLEGISDSSVDYGDYDNDGDLDICFLGLKEDGTYTAGVYENQLTNTAFAANTAPVAPAAGGMSETAKFRTQLTLTWGAGSDARTPAAALSYNVTLRDEDGLVIAPQAAYPTGYLHSAAVPNGQGRRLTLKNIPEGNLYWAVQSVDGGRRGSPFSAERALFHIQGPQTIRAEIVDPTHFKLSWSDNSLVETAYRIERSTGNTTSFSELATIAAGATEHTDAMAFAPETFYHYRIFAMSGVNRSGYDSLFIALPAAPGGVSATSVNASTILVKWSDLSSYETRYVIERKKSGEADFSVIATIPSNRVSYSDQSVAEGTYYEYRVRATNQFGSSALSPIVSAVTNFRPAGGDFEIVIDEDNAAAIDRATIESFYSDGDAADELASIRIETLPESGTLFRGAAIVDVNDVIPAASLDALEFVPGPDENGEFIIVYRVADGKDLSLSSNQIRVVVNPVNDPPVFFLSETIEFDEDFGDGGSVFPFAVWPENENGQSVTYSMDPTTSSIINVSLDETTGALSFTSVSEASGMFTFVLTADDGQSSDNIYSQEVTVIVYNVNDPPVVSPMADLDATVDEPVDDVVFNVTDADDDFFSLIISATSSNQSILPDENITVNFDGETTSLALDPLPGVTGETVITVTVQDSENTVEEVFTLTVNPVMGTENAPAVLKPYPNPATSWLHLGERASGTVTITTLTGQTVHEGATEDGSLVDVSRLAPGTYILKIRERNGKVWAGLFTRY